MDRGEEKSWQLQLEGQKMDIRITILEVDSSTKHYGKTRLTKRCIYLFFILSQKKKKKS